MFDEPRPTHDENLDENVDEPLFAELPIGGTTQIILLGLVVAVAFLFGSTVWDAVIGGF